jgi:hypothetical protein
MTKIFFAVLALTFATAPAFAGDIFRKTFKDADDEKIEEQVFATYKDALASSKPNALKALVAKIKKSVEDSGTVEEPGKGDIFQTHFGKGSATSYGMEYILGVPVAMQGTGNIREYQGYVRVRVAVEMGTGTTVIFSNLVKFVDQK